MAGLRVAYLVASGDMLQAISDMLDPWCISTFASLAANAAVQDAAYILSTLNRNAEERAWLTAAVQAAGCSVFSGSTNFVLFRLPQEHRGRCVWERLIVDHGIVMRNCATFEGLDASYMRTAVRRREDNERLVCALASLLIKSV
jgi:threonine-phosphate decarboxylase